MTAGARMPKQLTWIVAVICVLPFLLHLSGVDWGTSAEPFDSASAPNMTEDQRLDAIFFRLSGVFTHTILEWSAFSVALFTVRLSFIHFSIKRDITTIVIGVALFFAGTMDAFHTLAADFPGFLKSIPACFHRRLS